MPTSTLVIIPTSFCKSSMYDKSVELLRSKGHSVHVLEPPTFPANYRPNTPAPSMYDDAAFIANFVERLADEGNDIVILAHGYGGSPASQSVKGLTKHEREAVSKPGGVVRLAFVTGVVPKIQENTVMTLAASAEGGAPQVEGDGFGWMSQIDPEATASMVFNSLSSEEQIQLSKGFGRHAAPGFLGLLTYPGYQDLPVSWYLCEEDLSVVPEVQQAAIHMIERSWEGTERHGTKVDVTKSKCDHFPFVSATPHLSRWIEEIISAA